MSRQVLILGCGPAGLIAAWSARMAGFDPLIVSRKAKSSMFGAQYLHGPIPGLHDADNDGMPVEYKLEGTSSQYRDKVYGEGYRGTVSPDELPGAHQAWDIRGAYDRLWDIFVREIYEYDINPQEVKDMVANNYAAVFNSIPAESICRNEDHIFRSEFIKAYGTTPLRPSPVPIPPMTVICSGLATPSWYRASNVFGYQTIEWPDAISPPLPVARVRKPLKTNCDCWTGEVQGVGRYGKWTKGELSHTVYGDVQKALEQL